MIDKNFEKRHYPATALLLSVYCVCASANVVTFGTPDVQLEICYKKRILKGLRNPVVFTFDNYIRVEAPPHRYNTELAVRVVRGGIGQLYVTIEVKDLKRAFIIGSNVEVHFNYIIIHDSSYHQLYN
uniref:Uncharacterized protein n=1 Tax=Anopheles melas TaxID=34690 RepID=A0A182TEX6_9DIPT